MARTALLVFSSWLLLAPPRVEVNGQQPAPRHLCVFVPISPRSRKDTILAHAALETWASPAARAAVPGGASVTFLSPPGAEVHPGLARDTVQIPTDVDTDYRRLPIRTFLMWEHLGVHRTEDCRWFMKADADSYVNLAAVAERLACFDSQAEHYFGVVHAILPAVSVREHFPAMFFAHGGSGYIISQGLAGHVGYWSAPCLHMTMNSTNGDAMEDVAFAMCLINQGVTVMNYGYMATEFVVNFHQARLALLNTTVTYTPSPYWDAKPPPLGRCLLVVHPVEQAEDLMMVHARIAGQASQGRDCAIQPMDLARQAETRMAAMGGALKMAWDASQLGILHDCFAPSLASRARSCRWRPLTQQCYGLSRYLPASTREGCAEACCLSDSCMLYQFRSDLGCWLGEEESTVSEQGLDLQDGGGPWEGGAKVEEPEPGNAFG